jgi:hypothetical protein
MLSFRFFRFFKFLDHKIHEKCRQFAVSFEIAILQRIMNDSSREEWIKIMKHENNFLLINEIWTLINSFKNQRVLRDKWIYKIKKKHDEILRYKTLWMIREFEQIERLNYTKKLILMIKLMNYKIMYVIIVVNDWKIEQMNVKTIFLYDKV